MHYPFFHYLSTLFEHLQPLFGDLGPLTRRVVADHSLEKFFGLVCLFEFRKSTSRFTKRHRIPFGVVVGEGHDEQGTGCFRMPLLLQSAEADLQLSLGGSLGRRGRGYLRVSIYGIVELLLILPGPADSVTCLMYPETIAEPPNEDLV